MESNHRSSPCQGDVLPLNDGTIQAPRPGFEPGTPGSKPGMMSVSPSRHQAEGEGLEPSSPEGERLSRPARRTDIRLPSTIKSLQRKARESNPHSPKGSAFPERPGNPYPAAFRACGTPFQWCRFPPTPLEWCPTSTVDLPGIEPGSPVCRTGVVPLDHKPVFESLFPHTSEVFETSEV